MRPYIYLSRYAAHPLAWWAYLLLALAGLVAVYALLLRLWLGYHYALYTCGRSLVTKIRPDMARMQQRCTAAEEAVGHLCARACSVLRQLHAY